MPPRRTEELSLQLCCHVDETRVSQRHQPHIQEENWGYGPVSPPDIHAQWPSLPHILYVLYAHSGPLPHTTDDSWSTDVQTHRSWKKKLLHVPSVASSYHRMSCCASPARTTCHTASPRYTHRHTQSIFQTWLLPNRILSPYFVLSGPSHAERGLGCVSSLWISCSLLTVYSVSKLSMYIV